MTIYMSIQFIADIEVIVAHRLHALVKQLWLNTKDWKYIMSCMEIISLFVSIMPSNN